MRTARDGGTVLMITPIASMMVVAVLLVCLIAGRWLFGRTRWVLLPTTFMAVYLLVKVVPGVVVASGEATRPDAVVGHLVWAVGMLVGLVLARGVMRGLPVLHSPRKLRVAERRWVYFLISLGILAVIVMFRQLGNVPLLIGLSGIVGDTGDVLMHEARRMNTAAHREGTVGYFGQGYLKFLYQVIAPIAVCALLLSHTSGRHGKGAQAAVGSLIGFFLIAGALNGQIWIAAQLAILFGATGLIAYVFRSRHVSMTALAIRAAGVYGMLLLAIAGFRRLQGVQGRTGLASPMQDVLQRLYGYPQVKLFEYFPEREGFRLGATWLHELGGILPGLQESFAYEVHAIVHGGGWGYTLAPGMVASAYVNFGFAGVFATALFAAALMTIVVWYLVDRGDSLSWACALSITVGAGLWMDADVASVVIGIGTVVAVLAPVELLRGVRGRHRSGQALARRASRRFP
jgi:hypothetical protein